MVTGAVGILGRRFSAGLADHGASVAVVDLDETATRAFARDLQDSFGTKCMGIAADIADPSAVRAMADTIENRLGPIDVLHNNAQAVRRDPERYFASVENFDLDTWRAIMSVNLDGAFLVAQDIGTRMAKRGRGSIIQTASIYGVVGPDQRIYEGSEYLGRPHQYAARLQRLQGRHHRADAIFGHLLGASWRPREYADARGRLQRPERRIRPAILRARSFGPDGRTR